MKEDFEYPWGTPKNVVEGRSHFVKSNLLQKAIDKSSFKNATDVSIHCFYDRGKDHAREKVDDWIKHRYPAMNEDLAKVWKAIDPDGKYKLQDFWFTDYWSDEYHTILTSYRGYAAQKKEGRQRSKTRNSLRRGDKDYGEQTSLF